MFQTALWEIRQWSILRRWDPVPMGRHVVLTVTNSSFSLAFAFTKRPIHFTVMYSPPRALSNKERHPPNPVLGVQTCRCTRRRTLPFTRAGKMQDWVGPSWRWYSRENRNRTLEPLLKYITTILGEGTSRVFNCFVDEFHPFVGMVHLTNRHVEASDLSQAARVKLKHLLTRMLSPHLVSVLSLILTAL